MTAGVAGGGMFLSLPLIAAAVVTSVDAPALFEPAVAGIRLGDASTTKVFLKGFGGGLRLEEFGFVKRQFLTADRSQLLEISANPGGSGDVVDEICVRLPTPSQRRVVPATGLVQFVSSKGIGLGASPADVGAAFGKPQETAQRAQRRVLVYRCADPSRCPFLQHANMPEYRGTYVFEEGRLVEFCTGYPYP